jgi:serine/threonine protein kinase
MSLPAADRLVADRYALKAPLGRGGMGVVWRAQDAVLGREVAVKEVVFPPTMADDERRPAQARVMREARAAARLNHPGAVTLYDVVQDHGGTFIVMELVNAPTLAELVRAEGPLPVERVAEIGAQVASALEAAHLAGIVHRDVKPGNVMVPDKGMAKLADFGIASLQGDPQLTSTGLVIGSPAYMAPEQAKGEESGPPADFWALGATMFYAVEGEPPFDRGTSIATLAAVVNDPPRTPRRAGALTPLVTALLSKDPGSRPSGPELRAELGRLVAARPFPPTEVLPVHGPGRTVPLPAASDDSPGPAAPPGPAASPSPAGPSGAPAVPPPPSSPATPPIDPAASAPAGAGVVDNREHPTRPSATLPNRGPRDQRVGVAPAGTAAGEGPKAGASPAGGATTEDPEAPEVRAAPPGTAASEERDDPEVRAAPADRAIARGAAAGLSPAGREATEAPQVAVPSAAPAPPQLPEAEVAPAAAVAADPEVEGPPAGRAAAEHPGTAPPPAGQAAADDQPPGLSSAGPAAAEDPDPGTAPAGPWAPGADREPSRPLLPPAPVVDRRGRMAGVLALLVVLGLAAVLLAVNLRSGGGREPTAAPATTTAAGAGTRASETTRQATSTSEGPETTKAPATTAAAGGLPEGWTSFTNERGSNRVGVPPGWKARTRERFNATVVEERAGDRRVFTVRSQNPSAPLPKASRDYRAAAPGNFDDFREVSYAENQAYAGHKGAVVFEYEATRDGRRVHVSHINFKGGTWGYNVEFIVPAARWDASQGLARQFEQAFQALG